ncbi:MAG TPA: hypothetical protein VFW34_09340 [Candidatus Rubrimentiphilum sp.]|nr:hypothetical protein [Candidatus Rubrimentiphilum sp.]
MDLSRLEFLQATAATIAAAGLPAVTGGRTLVLPFASAPYPHASRAQGHTYQGRLYDAATHYSNSDVGIFIPDNWQPRTGALDFVVHFYGWNHDIAATFSTYRLREQMVASRRNAILIVPEGPTNAPDSGFGKLELDAGGFRRFISDVATQLKLMQLSNTDRVDRIVLTAHSGGYGGAGGVLTNGGMNDSITDVLLFDAAYGYFDAFADWARVPQHHLLSLFTSDTSTGNAALMGKLQAPTPNLYVRLADSMTLSQLQTRAPTFVLTRVAHDELLQKYSWYSLFLQTTALDPVS